MNLSMNISKSGMHAQQKALDTISHNIANVNTDGYKSKTVSFKSLLNNQITEEDVLLNPEGAAPGILAGVRSDVSGMNGQQGSLMTNPNQLQLAAAGEGYFGVQDADGEFYLTRDGSFTIDGSGQVVNGNGDRLVMTEGIPAAEWPEGTVSVSGDGSVFVGGVQTGTIPLFIPPNNQPLVPTGENKFMVPEGEAVVFNEGSIQQKMIELSNVDLAQEMSNMIIAQRAYSLNVKVAQSTDEMMTMINQFNR